MPNFGVIVYGVQNGTLRSIILLDYATQPVSVLPGEAALHIGPTAVPPNVAQAKQSIFHATNVQPPSGRCCVIANGAVVNVINADPAIDSVPDGTLVSSDIAIVGDLYTNGGFQRRYAVVQVGTGLVTSVIYASPNASSSPHLIASTTLNVGDIVPLPTPPTAI